jgi:hypothetical protein
MEIAGMVYMGEYSSACLCQIPGGAKGAAGAAAAGAGAVGVIMQKHDADDAAAAQHHH